MMRKNPRRNNGPFVETADGWERVPSRRAHGIFTHVKPTPSAIASAKKRAGLYMHSAARKRQQPA